VRLEDDADPDLGFDFDFDFDPDSDWDAEAWSDRIQRASATPVSAVP
jgi:hypothetical protein